MDFIFLDHYRQFFPLKMRIGATENYSSLFIPIEKNFLYINRKHTWPSHTFDLDIHSRYWSVAFFKDEMGPVALTRLGQQHIVCPNKILFIPPWSLLHWTLFKGEAYWEGFIGRSHLNFHSQEPILYDLPLEPIPHFSDEMQLLNYVKQLKGGKPVGYRHKHSIVADRIKERLDLHFPQFLNMQDLAAELNLKHPSLDREFKATFGLSPREYNVRQRTLAAALSLHFSENIPVNQVASEMGFQHMTNFYKQCQRYLNTKPSFLKSKKINSLTESLIHFE